MSTSVQQTTEVVAPMPIAETPWAASCVPVNLDSTEMDSPVQVIQKYNCHARRQCQFEINDLYRAYICSR